MIEDLDADKKGLVLQVIDHIAKTGIFRYFFQMEREFYIIPHFGPNFSHSLVFEFPLGLVVHSGPPKNEVEVRHQLLTQLLNKVAHCASMMKAPSYFKGSEIEYSSELNLETKTDSSGTRGRKPEVNCLLSGYVGNEAVYRIPAESKVKMKPADMSQLSQYICLPQQMESILQVM